MTTETRTPNIEYRALNRLPGYLIGADGSIISLAKEVPAFRKGESEPYRWQRRGEKRMAVTEIDNGKGIMEYKVKPYVNGKQRTCQITRLVLEAFRGWPLTDERYYAWSLNRDASDARIENLKWVRATDTALVMTETGNRRLTLKPGAELL